MNRRMVLYLAGCVLLIEAGLLLLPVPVALAYGDSSAKIFLEVASAAAVVGLIIVLNKPKNRKIFAREGFVATCISWMVISAVGAVPFTLSGQIPSYLDALFETISGFTTTGASILSDVEALDHGMLFWRSFSHWIGGMGVLVFMLAILPASGDAGQNLYLMRAESPGPQVDKLTSKMRDSAAWLYGIYIGLTALCFLFLLTFGRMHVFDAACMTFGAAGTGGFSILNSGFAGYTYAAKVIVTVFMLLFGLNFNFYYYLIMRKFRSAFGLEEIRWYAIIYFGAVAAILGNLAAAGMLNTSAAHPIDVFFSVSSLMTTTGYATADFNLWPTFSRILLVLIMIPGACAGSTGGGTKISRWVIYCKGIYKEFHRIIHPRAVRRIRMDGKTVDDAVLQNTFIYMVIYVLIFIASILVVALDGQDTTTTVTSVVATLNNIGPGLNAVGPTGNFGAFSPLSKIVLMFDMLAGRLELYPVLITLFPSIWRRHS